MNTWTRSEIINFVTLIFTAIMAVLVIIPSVSSLLSSSNTSNIPWFVALQFLLGIFLFLLGLWMNGNLTLEIIRTYYDAGVVNDTQHPDNLMERLNTKTHRFIFGLAWFAVISLPINLLIGHNVNLDLLVLSQTWLFTILAALPIQGLFYTLALKYAKEKRDARDNNH